MPVQQNLNLVADEGYVSRSVFLVRFWFFGGIAALFLGYFGVFAPASQTDALWFQRSGAVGTFMMVMADRRLSILIDKINPRGFADQDLTELWSKHAQRLVNFKDKILVFALYSTVVWGYGDLMHH